MKKHKILYPLTCVITLLIYISAILPASAGSIQTVSSNTELFSAQYISENISNGEKLGVQNICWSGDICYAYLSDMSVYSIDISNGKQNVPIKICDLPAAPDSFFSGNRSMTEKETNQLYDTVTYVASNSNGLYGFNVYNGKFGKIDKKGINWNDQILNISCLNPANNFFPNRIAACFLSEDAEHPTLYTFVQNTQTSIDNAYEMYSFDTETGKSKSIPLKNAVGICQVCDNNFLILEFGNGKFTVLTLNCETNESKPLNISFENIPSNGNIGGIASSADGSIIAISANSRVYTSRNGEPFKATASVSTESIMPETSARILNDGRYCLMLDGAQIRSIDSSIAENQPSSHLTVQAGTLPESLKAEFKRSNPDTVLMINSQITNAEDFANAMSTHDDSVDVYELRVDYTFMKAKSKGFMLPIISDEVSNSVSRMYEMIQNVVLDDSENVVALPSRLYLEECQVNTGFWNLAFEGEELPASVIELLDYWFIWEQDYADEYTNVEFMNNFDYARYVKKLLSLFAQQNSKEDGSVDFTDPELAAALQKLTKIYEIRKMNNRHTELLSMDDEEGIGYIFQFTTSEAMKTLSPAVYKDESEFIYDVYMYDYTAIPMPFSSNGSLASDCGVMYVYVINPYSKHQEEALNFITAACQMNINPYCYYAVHPDCNLPLANENFEARIAQYQDQREDVTAQLETADGEYRQMLEDKLAYYDAYIGNQEKAKWLISEDTILSTREKMQNLKLHENSLYLGSRDTSADKTISEMCSIYCGGNINIDKFLRDLQSRVRSMQLEAY